MENDTRNTSYWIVTVEDGHYASGSTDYTKDSAAGTLNLGQDWFIERDDIDRDVNLCIQPDGTETGWGADISYFACKEIWCEMQRKFTTLDYYDFDFDPNGVTENLIIATGDASLLIGQDGRAPNQETITNTATAAIELKVLQGSLSGIMTTALATAAMLASFSF